MDYPQQIWLSILEIFYPKRCVGCVQFGDFLCFECAKKIEVVKSYTCYGCGKISKFGKLCPSCQNRLDTSVSSIIYAADYHNDVVKKLIASLKYDGVTALVPMLSSLLLPRIPVETNAIIAPVPLHSSRQKSRGFNQSELIAKEVSTKLGIAIVLPLKRVKKTRSQVGLSKELRTQNLADAFKCTNPAEIVGKTVFLIDDVVTTGSTFSACATVLKAAGAKRVICLAIARNLQTK